MYHWKWDRNNATSCLVTIVSILCGWKACCHEEMLSDPVCNDPTDTAQGFGLIAQSTQMRCSEGKEPEPRVLICSSLQVFCLMHTFMCCNSTVPQDCRNSSHSCALIFLKLFTSTSDIKAYKLRLCRSICALR
jgi:hypothetical protein